MKIQEVKIDVLADLLALLNTDVKNVAYGNFPRHHAKVDKVVSQLNQSLNKLLTTAQRQLQEKEQNAN